MSNGSTPRFVADRPIDRIRVANPWRPYARYISELEAAIASAIAGLGLRDGQRVLDFGCAERPYHDCFPAGVEVVGADLPGNAVADVHVVRDGSVPEASGSFDAVLSTQVLEHVAEPAVYLAESARLLRPGGQLLLSTHGYFFFHPDPVDYWRWTGAGLRKVVEDAGLRATRFEGVFGSGAVGLQFALDAVLPKLPRAVRGLACRTMHPFISYVDDHQSADAKRLNAAVYLVTDVRD